MKLKTPQALLLRMTVLMLFVLLLYHFLVTFRNFLYPIFLGVLFAYLLYPIAKWFEDKNVPRIPANLISIFIGIIVIYGLIFFIYTGLKDLVTKFPELEHHAISNIKKMLTNAGNEFGFFSSKQTADLESLVVNLFRQSQENIGNIISATAQTVFAVIIMPVYVFFLLYYRNKYRTFFMMLIREKHHGNADNTIQEISTVTRKYMTGLATVVLIMCIINSTGLYIIGIRYALLLGTIAAIFNFIPYFGTIIGYSFPFMMALLTEDSPKYALFVVILFVIVQFIENNILTPNITGGLVRINPFFIILGVLISGVVWGLPGMFIVVPLLAAIKIICDHVPSLKPYAFLIGDTGTEKYALTLEKIRKLFKR